MRSLCNHQAFAPAMLFDGLPILAALVAPSAHHWYFTNWTMLNLTHTHTKQVQRFKNTCLPNKRFKQAASLELTTRGFFNLQPLLSAAMEEECRVFCQGSLSWWMNAGWEMSWQPMISSSPGKFASSGKVSTQGLAVGQLLPLLQRPVRGTKCCSGSSWFEVAWVVESLWSQAGQTRSLEAR